MADKTIQIIIDVNDRTGGKLGGLKSQLLTMDAAAEKLNARFKNFATLKYSATLRLIDRVTEPASRINSLLKKIAGGVYGITMRLNDSALSGLRKIESTLMKIAGKTYNIAVNLKGAAGQKLEGLLGGAAMGAGLFAPMAGVAGLGFGVGNAISAAASFEKQMSKVQAIRQLDKNSEEMRLLTEQAKQLGMTTAWTRKEVGEAQYYQALAGWKTKEILSATPHMVNLASAADMDLKSASDLVTDAMTAFGLKASDKFINKGGKQINAAEYFMDMLAKVQASSNTDLYQLRESLKYGASTIGTFFANVGGQEGVQKRMEAARQLMIMQGAMANAGIKGSLSGTGVNTLFNRLAGGTRGAVFAEQLLGLKHARDGEMLMPLDFIEGFQKKVREGMTLDEFYQAAELFEGEKIHADTRRQLDGVINHGLKNFGKLGSEDIIKLSKMIAGVENAPKLTAMLFQDLEALKAEMTDVEGTAAGMAATQLDNLAGSFTYLHDAWDAFQQDLFTGTAGDGLRSFVDTLTEILTRANNLFKDGIQLGDFGAIIGDVISRLKNKFLELDGIGSILAGGALAMALKKIISLGKSALTIITDVPKFGGTGGGLSSAQKIGTMTVTAGVVNVNGAVGGGGRKVGNTAIIDNYNQTKERIRGGEPPAPSIWSGAKSAAGSAAAFSAIFGAFDILNTKSFNAERLAQAPPEMRAQIMQENRLAEWETGGGVAGSVLGAAIGAGLLSAAGPLGTAIGGIIGSVIGEKIGRIIGHEAGEDEETRQATNFWKGEKASMAASMADFKRMQDTTPYEHLKGIAEAQARRREADEMERQAQESARMFEVQDAYFKQMGMSLEFDNANRDAAFEYYRQRAADMANFQWQLPDFGSHAEAAELNAEQLAQQAAMERGEFYSGEPIQLPEVDTASWLENLTAQMSEGLVGLQESVGEIFYGIGESASEAFTGLSEVAASALEGVTSAFTAASEVVLSTWSALPDFFSGILAGLGGAAEAAGSAIYGGLTSVIGGIIGAWESAAATVSGIIASISAVGSSVSATVSGVIARVRGHAEGGFITSPELAMVGEAGTELILPLTDRERSLDLLSQASGVLGISEENPARVELNVTFNISGDNPQNIVETIKENIAEIADAAAQRLSVTLGDAHANRGLT